MIINQIRIIVPDIEIARKQIQDLADKEGWVHNDEIAPKTAGASFERSWAHFPTNTSIHYIENDFVGLDYLEVLGTRYQEVADTICKHVDVKTRSDVLKYANAAQTDEELANAVRGVLGISSSQFDKELFAVIEKAAASKNSETRFRALVTIGYVEWEECKDILVQFIKSDPDDEIRTRSQKLLKTLQETWDDPEDYS